MHQKVWDAANRFVEGDRTLNDLIRKRRSQISDPRTLGKSQKSKFRVNRRMKIEARAKIVEIEIRQQRKLTKPKNGSLKT